MNGADTLILMIQQISKVIKFEIMNSILSKKFSSYAKNIFGKMEDTDYEFNKIFS